MEFKSIYGKDDQLGAVGCLHTPAIDAPSDITPADAVDFP